MLMKDKIKAVQKAINTPTDGKAGPHTWDLLYRMLAKKIKYPYEGLFWSAKVILARPDQLHIAHTPGKNAVKTANHRYAINGTFYYAGNICSLLGSAGSVYGWYSCRAWAGYPETVLYYDGVSVKTTTAKWEADLSNSRWFIGGIDLINYRPEREGFCRFTHESKTHDYRDVLRRTYHACIGVDKLGILHAFVAYGTGQKMAETAKNLMLTDAIMLDGGSPCSFNSPSLKYQGTKTINNLLYFE